MQTLNKIRRSKYNLNHGPYWLNAKELGLAGRDANEWEHYLDMLNSNGCILMAAG